MDARNPDSSRLERTEQKKELPSSKLAAQVKADRRKEARSVSWQAAAD